MRCDDVAPELIALERGETDETDAGALRAHLEGCAACAAESRRLARTLDLVSRGTALAPTAGGSARLLAAVDEALRAERVAVRRRGEMGLVRGAWTGLRDRYRRSASFRRFTLASLAIHAAAAGFLTFLIVRPATHDPAPDETDVTARFVVGERPPEETLGELPAFEPATRGGVRTAGGRAFPNGETAQALGTAFDAGARADRLNEVFGEEADEVEDAIRITVAGLLARQAPDGSFGVPGDLATTARVAEALAAAGRDPRNDASLARASEWLERNAGLLERPGSETSDLAAFLSARVVLYSVEFDGLDGEQRLIRSQRLARDADALARRQVYDGSFPEGRELGDRVDATLVATRALVVARDAGIADTGGSLSAAATWLGARRGRTGHVEGADRPEELVRTATLASLAPRIGLPGSSEEMRSRLASQVASLSARHPAVAAAGVEAFGPTAEPVARTVRVTLPRATPAAFEGANALDLVATVRTLSRPLWN